MTSDKLDSRESSYPHGFLMQLMRLVESWPDPFRLVRSWSVKSVVIEKELSLVAVYFLFIYSGRFKLHHFRAQLSMSHPGVKRCGF